MHRTQHGGKEYVAPVAPLPKEAAPRVSVPDARTVPLLVNVVMPLNEPVSMNDPVPLLVTAPVIVP